MRRNSQPPLDLVPVMGLASLLIPLLLIGQGGSIAVVDANIPVICGCLHGCDHPVVPTVHIRADGIFVGAGEPTLELGPDDLDALSAELGNIRASHETSGRIVILPDSDVPYERLISTMDAARPTFPEVTVAGGIQ